MRAKGKRQGEDRLDNHTINQFKNVPVDSDVEVNRKLLEELFIDSSDVVIRDFQIENGPKAMVCFIDGLTATFSVETAMKALMVLEGNESTIDGILTQTLPVAQTLEIQHYSELLVNMLSGDCALFIDGCKTAVCMGLRFAEHRTVSEPTTETVVRGPREGFTESIRINTALIRRKIKSPRLKMKSFVIGTETNTNVVVTYIVLKCQPELCGCRLKSGYENVGFNSILESGYIEELYH